MGKNILYTLPLTSVASQLASHPFNHALEILLPRGEGGPIEAPLEALGILGLDYLVAWGVRLETLLDPRLKESFPPGSISGLSFDTQIDLHDCVALTPCGKIILSVTKDTYEILGLTGEPSHFAEKGQRHLIKIDLKAAPFVPGKKNFERVQWSLSQRLNQSFNMVLNIQPKDQPLPFLGHHSSIQKKKVQIEHVVFEEINIPVFDSKIVEEQLEEQESSVVDIFEWIGLITCRGSDSVPEEFLNFKQFISAYSAPQPFLKGSLDSYRCTGLIPSESLLRIANNLQNMMTEKGLPWVALNVWGFRDSPISFNLKEHGFLASGENDFSILMLRGSERCFLLKSLGENDFE